MKLKFTVDTEDVDEDYNFDDLFSDALRREVMASAKQSIATEEFKRLANLINDSVVADVKLRMQNFLSEEIVLTGRYGEKNFVGSIEDLIKMRFDDVLLRPVDSSGKRLHGCTSASMTWVEWMLKEHVDKTISDAIIHAKKILENEIGVAVKKQLEEITESAIKEKVTDAFSKILTK